MGNIIVGGAGKTPTVVATVKTLHEHGWHPGVISRGYGRRNERVLAVTTQSSVHDAGDEPLLLHLRTNAPVVVGRDRVEAARELLRLHPEVDVIVSDDGLQHLRLPRCAQVIVFDERGAGNGWLLPAGPLREPLPLRVPPRSLVLYNAERPSTVLPGMTATRRLGGAVELSEWWIGAAPSMQALENLRSRPLLAAAGVAAPSRFFEMLSAARLGFTAMPLPDHFDFATLPWPQDTPDVIVTEKDAVKLHPARVHGTRVWVAPLDFEFDAHFERELLALLPPRSVPTLRKDDGFPTA